MKLGMIISQTDPETVFNAPCAWRFSAWNKATRCVSSFRAEAWKSTRSRTPSST